MSNIPQFAFLKNVYMAVAGVEAIESAYKEANQRVHEEVMHLKDIIGDDVAMQRQLIAYCYWYEKRINVSSLCEAFSLEMRQVRDIASQIYPDIRCDQCGAALVDSNGKTKRSLSCGSCKPVINAVNNSDGFIFNMTENVSPNHIDDPIAKPTVAEPRILITNTLMISDDSASPRPIKVKRVKVPVQSDKPKFVVVDRAEQKRLRELRAMPYAEYLNSPEWQDKRLKALRAAKYRCQACGGDKPLNVHHNTYERLGCERNSDLIALCFECHGIFHSNGKLAK